MLHDFYTVSEKDKEIIKRLGAEIFEIGSLQVMDERRRLWKKLNALEAERPMFMCETSGVLEEILPLNRLKCAGEWARGIERRLRSQIFHFRNIDDDRIIEPRVTYSYKVDVSDYGVAPVMHSGSHDGIMGSYRWDPPITDIEEGMNKLHFRNLSIDHESSEKGKALLEEVFDGILPVEHRGWYFWTQGLTIAVIDLIGLDGLMYAMHDQPEQLHRLMAFIRDDQLHFLHFFEKHGLLFPNNRDEYIGSGGCGCTDLLPQKDYVQGQPAGLKDMWGLSESQETVGVSPQMFEEFVFQYQLPVISKFGFACYGCCEPLDKRWHIVKRISNLRRVSVSPWANEEKMAEYLGRDYIYSRKPSPTLVSTGLWDEGELRRDIRKTMDTARGLNVEIVLKDVHTLCGEPDRLGRWARILREETASV